MELEPISAISGSASIALLGSAVFALTARAWIALQRPSSRTSGSLELLPEAAQRFRDEFDLLGRKQSVLLASALVFALLFGLAWFGGSRRLLAGTGAWLVALTAAAVAAGLLFGIYRLVTVNRRRRRLAFRRHATIAVGQALGRVSGDMNRIFHDVACDADIVDHVLVGQRGVFAIFVIARRPGRHNRVRLRGTNLCFAPGRRALRLPGFAPRRRRRRQLSVEPFATTSARLATLLRKATGNTVRVRPVLVVPGWEVEAPPAEELLVVNERGLGMLRGWADRSEYLMNEDVEHLHGLLAEQAFRTARPRSKNDPVPRGNA